MQFATLTDGATDAFTLVTDLLVWLVLIRVSLAAVGAHMAAAHGKVLRRRFARKWGAKSDIELLYLDLRLAHEPVVRAIESAKAGRVWRVVAQAFACNAV